MKKGRKTKHLPWCELAPLIGQMRKDKNRLHLLCTIMALLGLRVSDALNLTWEDLLSNAELTIIERKTKKKRTMRVNASLRQSVEDESGIVFNRNKKELIFLNRHATGPISVSYVNRMLKKSFKKYGVEAEQVSSHLLRKSWAYKILEDNDFSDKAIFTISRMMNHGKVSTTMLYLDLDQRESNEIYESLKL